MRHLRHIFQENKLLSVLHLIQEFGITSHQFLDSLQIKSSIKAQSDITTINLDGTTTCSQLISAYKNNLSQMGSIISQSDTSQWIKMGKRPVHYSRWQLVEPNLPKLWAHDKKSKPATNPRCSTELTILGKSFQMGLKCEICTKCTQNNPDTYIQAIWY